MTAVRQIVNPRALLMALAVATLGMLVVPTADAQTREYFISVAVNSPIPRLIPSRLPMRSATTRIQEPLQPKRRYVRAMPAGERLVGSWVSRPTAVDARHWCREVGVIKASRNKDGSLRTRTVRCALLKRVP